MPLLWFACQSTWFHIPLARLDIPKSKLEVLFMNFGLFAFYLGQLNIIQAT